MWLIFLNLHSINKTCNYSYFTRLVTSQFVALVTYVKYPNLDLIINIWKRKRLKMNVKFQGWKQISEVLLRVQAFIRFMKDTFYRLDYQKFLMYRWLNGLAEHLFQNMRPSIWNTQPSFWNTRPSFWGFKRKLKAQTRV